MCRKRQIEKARKMIERSRINKIQAKEKIATAFEKSNVIPNFTAVTNAFMNISRAADCASTSISNLVPNIRKRG